MSTKDGTLLINIIVETSASPLFTAERIQPEFSSFSIFLDDKLKRAVHTMPEVPWTQIQNIIMTLGVSKINVNKAWIQAKIHAEPPAKHLLPTSGAGCPRDTAYDVTVKPPRY